MGFRRVLQTIGKAASIGSFWAAVISGQMALAADPPAAKPSADTQFQRPRLVVDATYYPFSAMGRLQAAGQVFCSATLVSPTVILTAGHCLWDGKRKRWRPAADIHFVAGYQRSSFIAHGQGVSYVTPLTAEKKAPDGASVPNDWALVELDRPIGNDVGWLGLHQQTADGQKDWKSKPPEQLPPLFLAAYREDRAHALSLQSPCRIVQDRDKGHMLVNSCQVVHGSSGSPLVAFQNGRFVVVAVTSARISYRDRASETASVSTAALLDPDGPGPQAMARYKLAWNPEKTVRDSMMNKGLSVLIAALSDGPPPTGESVQTLDRLLRVGPAHDKIALPPMSFPELQKCRGSCAQADSLKP